jgi:integrase
MQHRVNVTVRKRPDTGYYQLRAISPLNGKELRRSAKTTSLKEAMKAAAAWEAELEQGIYTRRMTWEQLAVRFADEYLPRLKTNSRSTMRATLTAFGKFVEPQAGISSITGSTISQWTARLRQDGLRESTIARHLRCLKCVLNWAVSTELMARRPSITMPANTHKKRFLKGRALTEADFAVLCETADRINPTFTPLLKLLWLSGLRISEAYRLSFDTGPNQVDLANRRFVFLAAGQKSGHDETIPLLPELYDWLASLGRTSGPVVSPLVNGKPVTLDTTKRQISSIGAASGLVTGSETGKHVTAHDLRRSFGTRWALKVHPLVLKKLMRHETLDTTLRFYVDLDDSQIADAITGSPYTSTYISAGSFGDSRQPQQRKTRGK